MLLKDQDHLPNVPIQGWLVMKNLTDNGEKGCSLYPGILDIEYRNDYWQIFKIVDHDNVDKSTYHLYGAYFGKMSILKNPLVCLNVYLDNRTLLNNVPMVRILSIVKSRYIIHFMFLAPLHLYGDN